MGISGCSQLHAQGILGVLDIACRKRADKPAEISFDALVGSALPEQLAALGYIVEKIGESQRILAHAVAQKFETSSSGVPVPVTEGSTNPVTVTNAGIAAVEQYDLRMP
jgi:hypothetical protein